MSKIQEAIEAIREAISTGDELEIHLAIEQARPMEPRYDNRYPTANQRTLKTLINSALKVGK